MFANFWSRGVVALMVGAMGTQAVAAGLPTGASVVGGDVSVAESGNVMTITSRSQRGIVNFQSFNIGSGKTVTMSMPTAQAAILARVIGNSSSNIAGNLNANGQVFLVNPNGIIFGSTAQVNVGSLMATTLNITDENFMNGNMTFTQEPGKTPESVINKGNIQAADGDFVVLAGGHVENQKGGTITANNGQVHMVAGKELHMQVENGILVALNITTPLDAKKQNESAAITNAGSVIANGGTIRLEAAYADGLYTQAVNNTGLLQANMLVADAAGTVRLVGRRVEQKGDIIAKGGAVDIDASEMALLTNKAFIDVSAPAGVSNDAGSVSIRGTSDWLRFQNGAQIVANAPSGQGGNVTLRTEGNLDFSGTVNVAGATPGRTSLFAGNMQFGANRETAFNEALNGGDLSLHLQNGMLVANNSRYQFTSTRQDGLSTLTLSTDGDLELYNHIDATNINLKLVADADKDGNGGFFMKKNMTITGEHAVQVDSYGTYSNGNASLVFQNDNTITANALTVSLPGGEAAFTERPAIAANSLTIIDTLGTQNQNQGQGQQNTPIRTVMNQTLNQATVVPAVRLGNLAQIRQNRRFNNNVSANTMQSTYTVASTKTASNTAKSDVGITYIPAISGDVFSQPVAPIVNLVQ